MRTIHTLKSPYLLHVSFCYPKESETQIGKNSKGVLVGRYGGKKEDPLGEMGGYL